MLRAGDGPARRDEHGRLHLTPLAAENVDPVVHAAGDGLYARLPTVPLTEILIDIDRETGFSDHLTHAGGGTPRHGDTEHRRILYAALLAQACNFGATRMAELSGIPADAIDWVTRWYLREDTLRPANTAIVNKHYRHPLAQVWGGGTLSSSDGLRLPTRGKSLTRPVAVAVLPRRGRHQLHPHLRPALHLRHADHRLHRPRRHLRPR